VKKNILIILITFIVMYNTTKEIKTGYSCSNCPDQTGDIILTVNCCWDEYEKINETNFIIFDKLIDAKEFAVKNDGTIFKENK